jgi:hypothetical protein
MFYCPCRNYCTVGLEVALKRVGRKCAYRYELNHICTLF